MFKISNEIFESLNQKIKSKDYESARDEAFQLFSADNDQRNKLILVKLEHILAQKEMKFNEEQLKRIISLMDHYDEEILERSSDIYLKYISQNKNTFTKELDYAITQLSSFESIIREKFIDFFIAQYPWDKESTEKIIKGLIGCFKDELWQNRLKIVDFFNEILLEQSNILGKFKQEFKILLEETDLDVSYENLEFLFHYILETYSNEDFDELLSSLNDKNWYAQEKILWLTGKLGVKKPELLSDSKAIILSYLDHNDGLVQKKTSEIITEIVSTHNTYFDNEIFKLLQKDKLENLTMIEDIIKKSIVENGYNRFLQIYRKTSPVIETTLLCFISIVRSITSTHTEISYDIFNHLIQDIYKDFSQEDYLKLREIIEKIPRYDIYLILYEFLSTKGPLDDKKTDERRIKIINFMLNKMPELGYTRLADYLNDKLNNGGISLDKIATKFSMNSDSVLIIIQKLIKKGLVNAVINENMIERPIFKTSIKKAPDLRLLKQWSILPKAKDGKSRIKLFVRITNIGDEDIDEIHLVMDYPAEFLKNLSTDGSLSRFIPSLKQEKSEVVSWEFKSTKKLYEDPIVSGIKIVIIYRKNNKVSSLTKKLDIIFI
ncbi:MAG: hypothetical protein GF364_01880 [Candidatus Lokiarchaeota archaeon]|nr:hypothetical protein [Candidatus Lokiarchaeota archaeon]